MRKVFIAFEPKGLQRWASRSPGGVRQQVQRLTDRRTGLRGWLRLERYQDACARIPIEGKFGQGKARYGLAKIAARRADTSEAWVRAIFLVMNLLALERAIFGLPYRRLHHAVQALCAFVIGVHDRSVSVT